MSVTLDQKIHFVTGKGGVGKSFFAASLANFLTQKEKPVLLAEINEKSFYQDYFHIEKNIGFKPISFNNMDLSLWTGEDCLREYAQYLLKIESLSKLFFDNPVSKALVDVAPGLKELAILGKATSLPRKHGPPLSYKHMVFDSPSTGHFLSMFRAPHALAETIKFGPMGEQSRSIDKWLHDSKYCHIHIVSLPEELPATETVELFRAIKKEFGLESKVYLNKYFDLNLEQLKNEPLEVGTHFVNIVEQQTTAQKILSDAGIKYTLIPLITEADTQKLIIKAAGYLKGAV
ncbi:MAG: ArsA-related P-loop ATPase [Pseudobdellovibrio sp.]